MTEDARLLRRFVDEKSDDAFRELVARRIDFVYAAALRQLGGDTHLAQDVTQTVFLDLARKARGLAARETLAGWLYTSTRFAAAKAVRARVRRLNHEIESHTMSERLSGRSAGEMDWQDLRPMIDEALHELNEQDREVLLLRFFDGCSLAAVGAATGVAENAARMRVERALEKLRTRLARRGITSTAAALGGALAHQVVVAAPAGLAGAIASAVAGGTVAPAIPATIFSMNTLKFVLGAGAVGAIGVGGTYWAMREQQRSHDAAVAEQAAAMVAAIRADNEKLKTEVARLKVAAAAAETPPPPDPLTELRSLVLATQQKLLQPLSSVMRLSNGQLQPGTVQLFNLTPEEKAAIETEFADAKAKLDALAVSHVASVERASPTSVVVHFSLYPEEGGKLHDQVVEALLSVLGPERESALMTLTGSNFDWLAGNGFGAYPRTLTFERRAVSQGTAQGVIYTVVDRLQPTQPITRTNPMPGSSVTQLDRAGLERTFAAYLPLLPADF